MKMPGTNIEEGTVQTATIDWGLVGRTLLHPIGVAVLNHLAQFAEASPVEISRIIDKPLSNVSYHFKCLLDRGWIEEVRTRPRRGAVEHFYRLTLEIRTS